MSDESMNNFTPRAQQVLALARKEADRFNHSFVGTEHLLLGLINLGQGVAVNVLQRWARSRDRPAGGRETGRHRTDQKLAGNMPYTPRVKKVLELSKEAKALHHTYVGTEHILLGLLREGEGVAARVLRNLDIDIDQCRQEILHELDPNREGDDEVAAGMEEESEGGKQVKTPALKRSAATSLRSPRRARWIRSSAAPKSSGSFRFSAAERKQPGAAGRGRRGQDRHRRGPAQEVAQGNVPEILREKRVIMTSR